MNVKKMKMAYKRYVKNFDDGLNDVQAKYDEAKLEIVSLVESNAVDQDHKLLNRMYKISSYWLEVWKNEVLIKEGVNPMGLKHIQQVTFYQCMCRHIYKDRYPEMKVIDYSFQNSIVSLVHFNLFGWAKEEQIFFDFIVKYIGDNLMEANDWNQHIWFLLELYLQHTKQEIEGTNKYVHLAVKSALTDREQPCGLIPEELGIYREVLEQWNTPELDEITRLIGRMSEHHSMLASELGKSLEFGNYDYAFYPYEILYLLHVRKKQGLPNPSHFDDFLMNSPEAKMNIQDPEPYPEWDPVLRMIDDFYRKNYPEYIPNHHGVLFE
ncbi:hypothetical protein ABIC86_002876 [Paenibacillus sp. DS2363]|uniref:hypothetical protein n=1 Tax=unclassified Paenibacillus TaxID=185978 RepID=UPI000C27DE89|nr:hypothetical protein [Paenibacillus sp. GM1FR]PJN58185.1 hypothetical protein PAEAM_37570 [Paenibacillus sp. GM1FR]